MNATEIIASYVSGFCFEDIPQEVVMRCKTVILDTLGVMIRASISKGASERILRFGSRFGRHGRSTLIGTNTKTDPITAALVNGTTAHDIIELDEVHGRANTHTAAVLVPAALAVTEDQAGSGKNLLSAVVLGFDIECRIGIALDNARVYGRAFHPTSIAGCFCAAVAAGHVLKLNKAQAQYALGLAGSQACGLIAWENESEHMSKSFQTGVAARNGVISPLAANIYLNEVDWAFDEIRCKTAQGPYEAGNYHRFA
ncbi:MAG: MmgE/PrpD family protein, partial [Deltaproteobacteria bacterium]|nr:MmgE/PrpD family protein [Deltaproteobacteria bacterium]